MNATRKWVAALSCALTIGAQSAAAAGLYGYVANFDTNNVSVIDTASHTVIATVPVGVNPFGIAATPNGRFVYVTNSSANTVSVIDTSSNAVVATVPVGESPLGIAVTPDGRFAYVGVSSAISVIATATNTVSATVALGSPLPIAVAIAPDGRAGYVANLASNSVSVLNTATNSVTVTVPVGAFPFDVAVAPDGRFAYTANQGSAAQAVSVIDTAANTVVASIPLNDGPQGIAVAPDGRLAYTAHSASNRISVIDTATNAFLTSIEVGVTPTRLAVTPDGRFVYVTNQDSGNVSVIDTVSNTVVAAVPVGLFPQGVAFANLEPQDETAPSTTATTAPAANAAGWYNGPVTVILSATDNKDGSGVKSITYTVNGAATTVPGPTASFVVSVQGMNTVTYRATDNAGNAEAAKTIGLFIDSLAPTSAASATPPAGAGGINTGPVTVSVTAADSVSGVQAITILRTSGTSTVADTFPGASASVVVSAAGVTTVAYQAVDSAGNVELTRTLTIRIETPPAHALSAKVSVSPAVLWPPDRRFDQVHAHFKVANAVGRTKVKAVSVTSDEAVGRSPDWIVKGSSVKLRAERDDSGNGRVYTITYTLVDEAGNTAQASDTVAVPKHLGWRWNHHYSRWDRD